ncbi:hypothetical protein SAMN05660479_03275 [Microbulbifer thermotolerans]|nr:hypothetical protein SAMN05660479_03275 [Microbulbifer thermotolerans]
MAMPTIEQVVSRYLFNQDASPVKGIQVILSPLRMVKDVFIGASR